MYMSRLDLLQMCVCHFGIMGLQERQAFVREKSQNSISANIASAYDISRLYGISFAVFIIK